MINLYLGFFLSLLGHSIILLMVLLDFSIFFPNKKTYEVIPVGFILEKKENYLINEVQKNFFSLKNLESNNFMNEKFLKSKEKICLESSFISGTSLL